MDSTEVTTTMRRCLVTMHEKSIKLTRMKAGRWSHRHSPLKAGKRVDQFGSRTILAMIDRGLAEGTDFRGYDNEVIEIGLTDKGHKLAKVIIEEAKTRAR